MNVPVRRLPAGARSAPDARLPVWWQRLQKSEAAARCRAAPYRAVPTGLAPPGDDRAWLAAGDFARPTLDLP